jgi:hypothetical protein
MEIARSKLEYFQQNPNNIELLLEATYIGLNSLGILYHSTIFVYTNVVFS